MNITAELVVFMIGVFGAISGMVIGGWKWVDGRIKQSDDKVSASFDKMTEKLDELKDTLSSHRLEMVRDYVQRSTLREVQAEIRDTRLELKKDIQAVSDKVSARQPRKPDTGITYG